MNALKPFARLLVGGLLLAGLSAGAEERAPAGHALELSPGLTALLRAEMGHILEGVQSIPAGIATADWKSVADTGAQISASYIFNSKLTPAQRHELHSALPAHFQRLDASFHAEADKLATAARSHDAQLTAFHYYRMLDTCTACHALYAGERFPGFAPATPADHHHHH